MKKVNFSELVINDINDEKVIFKDINWIDEKLEQIIWNVVYNNTKDIELAELSKRIYKGEEIELRDQDINEIKTIINWKFSWLVEREIIKFIS